ncbi:MAG: methyltransferase domain-containing protein [Xenococcus sp. (in: cyanobacteria)]
MTKDNKTAKVKNLLKTANELKQLGQLEDALTQYLIALDLYPNFALLHYLLADTIADLKQWEKSIDYLYKAVELRPNSKLFQQKLESLSKNFDENLYLRLNEDVRIAISNGQFNSGYDHWLKSGRHEKHIGTRLCYKKQASQGESGFNVQSLYDNCYYQKCCGAPEYFHGNPHFEKFFDEIAKHIIKNLSPKTVLDAGCAIGFLVSKLRQRGVEAFGVDISEYAISKVPSDIKPYCWVGSSTVNFPRHYDLIICIEVLEHMSAFESIKSIENICNNTDVVLFASSPYDYKEATHFNVQPPEVWAYQFAQHGFFRDLEFDASFVCPWAVLYRKTDINNINSIVQKYERKLGLREQENSALRESLIEIQQSLMKIESQQNNLVEPYIVELQQTQEEAAQYRQLWREAEALLEKAVAQQEEAQELLKQLVSERQQNQTEQEKSQGYIQLNSTVDDEKLT